MIFRCICLVLVWVFCIASGLTESRGQYASAAPNDGTNHFVIHLQEGFSGHRQAFVAVDGREVYRDSPRTTEVLGLAAVISVTNASAHPVVTFRIPSANVTWSNRVDLSKGQALGFSLIDQGKIRVLQSTGFLYE
jgi:hypothetical protein